MQEVLLVNFYFGDDRVPTSRMVNDVYKLLKKKRIKVKIFCSNLKYKNLNKKLTTNSDLIFSTRISKFNFINKIFFFYKLISNLKRNSYKKILLLTDPPLIIFTAPIIKKILTKSEIIYWTMDLYPEALKESKLIPDILFKVLKKMKNYSLKSVDKIISLGDCQIKRLEHYSNFKSISKIIIHPWDYRKLTMDKKKISPFILKYPYFNKKVILYAGNIGRAHSIDTIIELIKYCEINKKNDYFFLFACSGLKKKILIKHTINYSNTMISEYFSDIDTPLALGLAYCNLITLEDNWSGVVVPSKLFGIINCGRPVIFVGPKNSTISKIIKSQNLGLTFENSVKSDKIFKSFEKIDKYKSDFKDKNNSPYKVYDYLFNRNA